MKPLSPFRLIILIALAAMPSVVRCQTAPAEPSELTTVRAHYDEEIIKATKPVKARYAEYLEGLKKNLVAKGDKEGALTVQREIDSLELASDDKASRTKIVVWNQHNAGFNDRGTKVINLVLFSKGKEVWHRNEIEIPWEPDKDTSVTIDVPSMPIDRIRVEITATVQEHGGLAEVEYWKDGKNLAKKQRVTVSGVWEENEHCVGATLTDGITTSKDHQIGYWLLPDGVIGWAEIHLR